jgi:hypothetical protein
MSKVIFSTYGNGYWSNVAKSVEIVDMQLGYIDDELDFGELRVYFNTKTWDVEQDGLIYTDSGFKQDLREFLNAQGLPGADVDYSEQGMQGDDYVSCDIGKKFLRAWAAKFAVDLKALYEAQEAAFNARWA